MFTSCLFELRHLLLWVILFHLCVSSAGAAAGVSTLVCYDTGSVGTCQVVTVQNYTNSTETILGQPSESPWTLPFDYHTKSNPQPVEQENGGGGYGGDNDDDHQQKRGGYFAEPMGQYFVVQVLVCLFRGIQTPWEYVVIQKPTPILFPLFEDYMGKFLSQLDNKIHTHSTCMLDACQPYLGPEMISAELLQASWQPHDNENPSSLELSLIPLGSQQAYALLNIPVYIQFTDWNDLDQQQAYWIEHSGELLELISASWVSLPSSQDQDPISCQVQVEEVASSRQVNLNCQLGGVTLPDALARLKEPVVMVMAIAPEETSSLDQKDVLDRIIMAPKGRSKGSQPKGKESDAPTAGKGKSRLKQARFVASLSSGGSQGEGSDEEQDPISKVSSSDRTSSTERLVTQLRKNIYKNIISRFLRIGKSRDNLAQVLFDLYKMLQSPVWTVSGEQRSFLQWFRKVQLSPIVAMVQGKYLLSSMDFLSLESLKKKIKRWDKNKVGYLTIDSLVQELAAALLDYRSTTLLLIKAMNKKEVCSQPLPLDTMREIEQFVTPTEATGPFFPYSLNSNPAPVRPLSRDFSGSLPSLVQHRIQPTQDTASAIPLESHFERSLSLQRQPSTPSRHHISSTDQTTTSISSGYFSQRTSTSTSVSYSSDSSGTGSQQSHQSTSPQSSATPAQLESLRRLLSGEAFAPWNRPPPQSTLQQSPYRPRSRPQEQQTRQHTASTLPRELENSLQSYRPLATALTEDQLVSLANAVRLDPRPYQSSDTPLLRDAHHGESRIMLLMIQYIEYHSRSGSHWGGLDMLLEQIRRVLPNLITDGHGRIEWGSMQPGASESTL